MNDKIRKICPGCGDEKKLSEYHKDKSKTYGVKTHCKKCRRELTEDDLGKDNICKDCFSKRREAYR